ncbi:hypothetical protein AB0E27_40210 [Streptomyces sparsogenes]|uniref:ParA family protein n=1 Tax=Streptomyces sparsogenes TaxID=67365 RepID=UPI0034098CBD
MFSDIAPALAVRSLRDVARGRFTAVNRCVVRVVCRCGELKQWVVWDDAPCPKYRNPREANGASHVSKRLRPTIDPLASTVWWANRITDLPFDFSQEHETPENLAVLKDTGARVHVIANQKGGGGRTTTTLNLGAVAADVLQDSDKGLQHVFIDTPGSLQDENLLLEALKYPHDVLVPMPPEGLAFDPTARTIQKVIEPTGLPFRVVIDNWDPRDGTADLTESQEYVDAQGWPQAQTVIRRYKVDTRASVEGRVVTQYPKNRVAMEAREDFFRLALEFGYGGAA